jgi:hypothetical protein
MDLVALSRDVRFRGKADIGFGPQNVCFSSKADIDRSLFARPNPTLFPKFNDPDAMEPNKLST